MTELLDIADSLYGLPLPEFTPARDARAKELKGTDLGKRVKALRKPSTAAWVVNLLVRRESEQVEQVLSVGAALREAQASMSGDELRALTKQRRQLTAAVTTQARRVAKEAGTRVTEAVADQVEATLTAAMVDEQCGLAVRSGLLVAALTTTGLDPADVAATVAVPDALGFSATAREEEPPSRPDLHVVPDPEADQKAVRAAEEELTAASEALDEATAAYDEVRSAYDDLEARSLQLQAEIDELRGRIAELETSAEEVDDELSDAEDARTEAEAAVASATDARDAAQAALDRLRG
jgi:DNA repair exonuclease SbcCD ATPase subunit